LLVNIDQDGYLFNEMKNLFSDTKEKTLGIWKEIEKPSFTDNPSVCAKCSHRFECKGRKLGSEINEVTI
jgi:MoaA/NifB/PqqE/SkfB family radical SAM enzyme